MEPIIADPDENEQTETVQERDQTEDSVDVYDGFSFNSISVDSDKDERSESEDVVDVSSAAAPQAEVAPLLATIS